MTAFIYYLSLPIIYLISWLPFPLLYLLSDLLYFILHKILRYRVQVVSTNLKNAFPDKTIDELKQIENAFYRYFCDLILETIKTLTITPSTVRKRVTFGDMSGFKKFYDLHQSVII
ncbi:MAG: hypothetical protein KDC80_04690, partial [Saprospiraceae bacterium]|nr:hypothetical protein [Saprospiraceae bacterium]